MLCCLNPQCSTPHNTDDATQCANCGQPLVTSLRGHYRPVQLLGQGGFGRTYLATDQDRLGTRCVIKQFSPRVQGTRSHQKAVRLFNQEAVRLHELGEHPQIPNLLAYFEQDGYLYLIQQFIKGQNLSQLVRRQGSFSEPQLREALLDILPVLTFVHDHQVIHRDITPMNILQRQVDNRLVLIDFGVAKQISEATDNLTGTRIGTEGYAPLEQFRSGRAYPASDLYSLGATCLYLLTQTRPDSLYDPLAGRWIWREYLVRQEKSISDRLAAVLERMLKDLVTERYQSATEVIQDLTRVVVGSPVPPPPRWRAASPGMPSGSAIASPPTAPPLAEDTISSVPTSISGMPSGAPSGSSPASRPPTSGPTEQGCLHVLEGHSSWVTGIALSPDQRIVASSGLDDTIYLWDAFTGRSMAKLTGHARGVNVVIVSPDGTTLLSGSDDYTIKEWNLSTGNLIRTLKGHSRDVNALAISANGKLLASGGEDRTIKLWQMGTGTLLKTLVGVAGMIKSVAMSPDNSVLVSGGFDNKIKFWSLRTGEQLKSWVAHHNSVNAVAVSPDSKLLASGSKDRTVRLWDLATGRLLHTMAGHNRDVNTLVFSPDGRMVVTGSSDATLKFWDVRDGSLLRSRRAHLDSVNAIALSGDGKILVSGGSDKMVKIWQVADLL
ncbi:serine/threonine-protein kinase [Leptolyngbya sp. CCY15150]|uniref:serine/threonine-protein kinase n=1 Tax=Leptolyngbya sp. CCY15150 TaxID=2767772 RepID=UPI00194E36F2|nr:serine/threonine-protein kinase [Leptolyngbya sp. CCY15150]